MSVLITVIPPDSFSFSGGVLGSDAEAAEALESARDKSAARTASVPTSLPYGGEFTGPEAFRGFFSGVPGGAEVWESFFSGVDQVLEGDDHFTVQLTNTAVPKATGKKLVFHNLWLFETADGTLVSGRLYADTAVVTTTAPVGKGP